MSRVGQLARGVVVAGLPGGALAPDAPRLGGYVLFARNGTALEEVRAFTDALRAHAGEPPPLIAIDQEGGAVARIVRGVDPLPPMMALGATGDADLARRAGEQTAFDLRRAGVTIDFAPVLDLALDPRNTVIGTRSFGADPHAAARLGLAFASGLHDGGVLPCYKHFPGHGATADDSHHAMPVIGATETELRARDLVPFAAVAAEAPAMMSAHVLMPAFDARRPATLSRRITTDLLRAELGFRGAFFTDCLEMNAVAAGEAELAVEALAAGADALLFSHDVEGALRAAASIEAAVADGRIALERLEEAHARVLALREAGAAPVPLDAFPPHPGVGREIARSAVTLVRGVPHADPLTSIAVAFAHGAARLHDEAPALQVLAASSEAPDCAAIVDAIARSQRRPIVCARRAHLHPAQAAAIGAIVHHYPDALVVSLAEPFDLPLFAQARHVLAGYGDDRASIGGLADVLFGNSLPSGRLPIDVDT